MLRHVVIVTVVLLLASSVASCAASGAPQEPSPTEELTLQLDQTPPQNPPASKPAETAPEDNTGSNQTPPADKGASSDTSPTQTPETNDEAPLTQNPSTPKSAVTITEVNPGLNQTPSSVTESQCSSPPTTGPTKAPEINTAELETQIHSLINAERTKQGLSPLAWNASLNIVARKHSEDMATRGYFNHTSSEGYGPMDRCQQAGLAIHGCAENIFLCPMAKADWYRNGVLEFTNYYTQDQIASVVVQGWMNSSGHRQNILNGFWTSQGIGVGISADNKVYITEDFN